MSAFSLEKGGYSRYLFEYRFDGAEWAMEVVAKSPEEARERIGALTWATYKGKIAAKIPLGSGRLIDRVTAFFR